MFKLRAIPVFRDETTLAMTPKLWPEIEKALRGSHFFILMAEPEVRQRIGAFVGGNSWT
jgi:hypothetical protein